MLLTRHVSIRAFRREYGIGDGKLYQGTLRLEVLNILASNEHGIVLIKEHGHYAGMPFEFREVHVWDIRNVERAKKLARTLLLESGHGSHRARWVHGRQATQSSLSV